MKKNVWSFGLIAGSIVSVFMTVSMLVYKQNPDLEGNMWVGYTSMLIAFAFVFVGIKNYRDKYCGGVISFGTAFKTGLYITLIASTMYVVTWMLVYNLLMPDFMDKYVEHAIAQAKAAGATAAELDKQMAEMKTYQDMYKNPLFVVLLTYMEILPVGLIVTLISSLILKRKSGADGLSAAA
jgi:small basic protein